MIWGRLSVRVLYIEGAWPMNDRTNGGTSVSGLMKTGLIASAAIPVILFLFIAVLVVFARLTDPTSFVLIVGGCAIAMLLGVLAVNYYVQSVIRDQLQGLVDVCRNYASGDRAVRAKASGDDEFAMLAMSLNSLLDTSGPISGSASSSSSGGDAAALQAQIEKLLQEVSAVGDGDLRVQAEVTPDTLGVLADSFNYMIEELAKVVGRVQSTAVQVTNATRRILDRSADLAQASETQVAQISQTSAAVEALAIFIQNVARNAQLSAEAARDALRNADAGQQAVRQSINGMMVIRENVQETSKKIKRLGERSNEIGEIVRIIEDIADQTNLLALNAAIQSAMAGEHGRGFAVVADEIRLLAERSTESTKRIATLVKSIQGDTYEAVVAMEDSTQEVVRGSQLADEAGGALNSIYTAVERQAQMIESIAGAAIEQAAVSENVAVAMSQISEITNQTNAATQEAAVSVSYLAELADQLRSSVATFRLPEQNNEVPEMLPSMAGVAALPSPTSDSFFAQDMGAGMNNEWNAGFAPDFLPLPQSQEPARLESGFHTGGFSPAPAHQFAFNNQQDFGTQGNLGGQQLGSSPNYPNQLGQQQGFANQQFSFDGQQFAAPAGFDDHQFGFGDWNGFEGQQNFSSQQNSGSMPSARNQSQSQPQSQGNIFPLPNQATFQPNPGSAQFGPNTSGFLQQGQSLPSRQRRANPAQNTGPFGQDQMPFPGTGNGYNGQ
jgi:methyl-accepting chemotaxis protein